MKPDTIFFDVVGRSLKEIHTYSGAIFWEDMLIGKEMKNGNFEKDKYFLLKQLAPKRHIKALNRGKHFSNPSVAMLILTEFSG